MRSGENFRCQPSYFSVKRVENKLLHECDGPTLNFGANGMKVIIKRMFVYQLKSELEIFSDGGVEPRCFSVSKKVN